MGIASEDENLSFLPLVFPLILVLVCVNVATLVYARTAARHTEIAVRASLGASRGRIIGQLFAEALVLSCAGSLLGLMVSRIAFGLVSSTFTAGGARMPFWLRPEITPGLVAYIVVLTLLAAFIVGVLPARSASLHGVRATLAQLAASDSVRLGRAWSVLIIAQVGVAVAVLPAIVSISAVYGYYSLRSPGFPTEQVLTATIEFDPSAQGLTNNGRLALLEQRLEAEPGFKDVTFATGVVGQELFSRFEFDDEVSDSLPRRSPQLRALAIAPDFMTQFGVALRAGRSFSSGDFRSGARTVVVNEEFVREFFEGRNVIGFRVRHYSQGNNRSVAGRVDSDSGPASGSRGSSAEADGEWGWMEIVGVVANFPPNRMNPEASESRVYEPMREGERHPVVMMHANTSAPPGSLSTLVTRIGLALDPGLRINRVLPLDVVYREGARGSARLASLMMALVTVCVLVLSGAGMSSLLSFTVTRRTREIGIRSALGADPRRILSSVFGRVLAQLGGGSAVGLFLAWSLNQGTSGELLGESGGLVIAGVVLLVFLAGFLAAWGPARRGLRIQPADALRSE